MTIPAEFQLHGQTIHVTLDKAMLQRADALGEAVYRTNTICLSPTSETWLIARDRLEQVFLHELVHFILFSMNSKLHKDEDFTDLFASLLHQALTTQKGAIE